MQVRTYLTAAIDGCCHFGSVQREREKKGKQAAKIYKKMKRRKEEEKKKKIILEPLPPSPQWRHIQMSRWRMELKRKKIDKSIKCRVFSNQLFFFFYLIQVVLISGGRIRFQLKDHGNCCAITVVVTPWKYSRVLFFHSNASSWCTDGKSAQLLPTRRSGGLLMSTLSTE